MGSTRSCWHLASAVEIICARACKQIRAEPFHRRTPGWRSHARPVILHVVFGRSAMLALCDPRHDRNCQGLSRRELLRIGGIGFGGLLTLPQLLAVKSRAAALGQVVKDRSVVLLFLQGGPSHIELFDPKMTAPSEIHSITGEVKTKLPGITFGGTFPKLAAITEKLAVVRSYGSQNANHTYQPVTTAGNLLNASLGSVYARIAGTNHARTGMPANILVLPEAVHDGLR